MTVNDATAVPHLRSLSREDGGFAMLALDQRESLRRMFPPVHGAEVGDDTLREFKREALSVLAPLASAVLLDRPYAVTDAAPAELGDTALILAADVLVQPPGEPVATTLLDELVTADFIRQVGAKAIKMLVIWREDDSAARREDLVRSFLAVAEAAGVASLVEGIVRPVDDAEHWSDHATRHDAILAAAVELSGYGGSIYKAEVPGYIPGDLSRVRTQSQTLTGLIAVPWVVLSNGVAQAEFPDAVREAVDGGASGFLAGRAIWADTVRAADPGVALRERSADRLRGLSLIVSEARAT